MGVIHQVFHKHSCCTTFHAGQIDQHLALVISELGYNIQQSFFQVFISLSSDQQWCNSDTQLNMWYCMMHADSVVLHKYPFSHFSRCPSTVFLSVKRVVKLIVKCFRKYCCCLSATTVGQWDEPVYRYVSSITMEVTPHWLNTVVPPRKPHSTVIKQYN